MSLQLNFFMPKSDWVPPSGFPEYLLHTSDPIAVDTETYDPLLKEKGASWRYKQGRIVGLCLADSQNQWYFPVGHLGGGNLPKKAVFDFFRDLLKNTERTIYMANAAYDCGWLYHEKILHSDINFWPGVVDVIQNEALIFEEHPRGYSLDEISHRRIKRRKDETLLRKVCKDMRLDPKADLWKLPSQYVGPYGEGDARNTYDVAIAQQKPLKEEGLVAVAKLENDLIPIFHQMTFRGIPIDLKRADQFNQSLLVEEKQLRAKIPVDPWSSDQVSKYLIQEGFTLPKTEKGNYSAAKGVLEGLSKKNNPAATILRFRNLSRLRETYVEKAASWAIDGRVHSEFLQLASDEGGTRTGRVSSRNPNFQQIPKRSEIGKMIRQLYHSGDKSTDWGKFDYSSQEPRWQVHYGIVCRLEGAKEVRDSFIAGKKLYTFMEENIPGVSYDDAKMLVLGRSYGMGIKTLAETMNISETEAEDLLAKFDAGVPYIGELAKMASASAQQRGFIQTTYGRRRHFQHWAPARDRKEIPLFPYGAAKSKWPEKKLERAFTQKAFNALIQGSSADQNKIAMLNIFKETGMIPFCPVHDELDYPVTSQKEIEKVIWHMENAIPGLECPFKVDCDLGKTWQ